MLDHLSPQQLAAAAHMAELQRASTAGVRASIATQLLGKLMEFARTGDPQDPDWPRFPVEETVALAVRLTDALLAELAGKGSQGRPF